MNCLDCVREIPETEYAKGSKAPEGRGARFTCPHCQAEHVRRVVGTLPSGEPLISVRLWGHPTALRRKSLGAAVGNSVSMNGGTGLRPPAIGH